MTTTSERPGAVSRALAAAAGLLLRVLLAVAGALFFAAALVAGLIASIGVLLWALFTGRRPAVWRFARGRWRTPAGAGGRGDARSRRGGEVIDVEAREVRGIEPRGD